MPTAIQFLISVSSTNQVVSRRPTSNPTLEELHLYTLQTQVRDTVRVGTDAGKCINNIIWSASENILQVFCRCFLYLESYAQQAQFLLVMKVLNCNKGDRT